MHPRVAVYTDASGVGGGEVVLGHLVTHLPPAVDVTVLGTSAEVVARTAAGRPSAATVVLPPVRGWWDLGRAARHVLALAWRHPDVVHVNLPVPWSGWYGIVGGLVSPGTVVTATEQLPMRTSSRLARWWKRVLSARLDAHLAVGETSARQIEGFAGLRPGSVGFVHNGVPDAGPVERVAHGGLALVGVGRLDGQKGFDVLLRALAELGADVRLVVVGGGAGHEELAALATELEVADRVVITGWTDEVRRHLGGADVFVLSSRSEGFPLALLEAMQAGLAVVATAVGSVPEAVDDGVTGLLVPKDDPVALADAVAALAVDPRWRATLGARARQAALAHTAERMTAEYLALWRRLLDAPSNGGVARRAARGGEARSAPRRARGRAPRRSTGRARRTRPHAGGAAPPDSRASRALRRS